ncbi:MAG: hypothetical protein IJP30_01860, partial [Clostridia bacterium]|nr:hypothetical protein [Clostridia bacterium]
MTKRKYICLALLMAVMLLVTGCDLVTVNRERDKAQVVIQIGDTAITKEQVYAVASTELAQSGMSMDLWDENLETYMREYLDEYLMEYVDGYAEYKVAVMLCDTLCPLTEEEIRQAEENTEGLLEYVRMMLGYDEENPEAYKGDIEADMDAYLKQTFGQTVAEYKASTLESNKYAHVYAKLTEGVAAQEGAAQAQYEKDLQAQKEAFAESADEYRSAITRNSMGDYILYKPAGYAEVKQILLGYEDEDGNAYDDLSLAKNEAEEELIEAEQKV